MSVYDNYINNLRDRGTWTKIDDNVIQDAWDTCRKYESMPDVLKEFQEATNAYNELKAFLEDNLNENNERWDYAYTDDQIKEFENKYKEFFEGIERTLTFRRRDRG